MRIKMQKLFVVMMCIIGISAVALPATASADDASIDSQGDEPDIEIEADDESNSSYTASTADKPSTPSDLKRTAGAEPAAVGIMAPDQMQPTTSSQGFTKTDSSQTHLVESGNEENTMAYLNLNSKMSGSFSSGIKASYEGSGSAEADIESYHDYTDEADELAISSNFHVNGVSVSLTIPESMGFEHTNSGHAEYSNSYENEDSASFSYSGIEADSYLVLYDATQKDSATFHFGTKAFSLNTKVQKF